MSFVEVKPSTPDIAENGAVLAESERFKHGQQLLVTDLDLERLLHDRIQTNTFHDANRVADLGPGKYRTLSFDLEAAPRDPTLLRAVEAAPFVPSDPHTRDERGALGGGVVHHERAAVHLTDPAGDRQTQPGPALVARPRLVGGRERLVARRYH